jgi:hypothetical protein
MSQNGNGEGVYKLTHTSGICLDMDVTRESKCRYRYERAKDSGSL